MNIYITIMGNPLTKKNGQQICLNRTTHRPFIKQSEEYVRYEHMAILQAKAQYHGKLPLHGPLNVQMRYYRATRHRVDLVNLEEGTLDVLTRAGVIEDDNYHHVVSMDGSRVFVGCAEPRVEITITEIGEMTE